MHAALHVQLTEAQAEQAGLRGAVVVAMRHLMTQQRATREMMVHLANALTAGPSGECAEGGQLNSSCVAAHQALASAVAGHLHDLAAAPQLDVAVSRMEGLLGPPPTAAEVRGMPTLPFPCQLGVQQAFFFGGCWLADFLLQCNGTLHPCTPLPCSGGRGSVVARQQRG